jgi:hypothetical protein
MWRELFGKDEKYTTEGSILFIAFSGPIRNGKVIYINCNIGLRNER